MKPKDLDIQDLKLTGEKLAVLKTELTTEDWDKIFKNADK